MEVIIMSEVRLLHSAFQLMRGVLKNQNFKKNPPALRKHDALLLSVDLILFSIPINQKQYL